MYIYLQKKDFLPSRIRGAFFKFPMYVRFYTDPIRRWLAGGCGCWWWWWLDFQAGSAAKRSVRGSFGAGEGRRRYTLLFNDNFFNFFLLLLRDDGYDIFFFFLVGAGVAMLRHLLYCWGKGKRGGREGGGKVWRAYFPFSFSSLCAGVRDVAW